MISSRLHRRLGISVVLLVIVGICSTTHADFTIVIGNGQGTANPYFNALQGTNGVVLPVFGYVTNGSPDLQGFNLAFDFAGDDDPINDPNTIEATGFGVPTGFDMSNLVAVDGGSPLDGSVSANNAVAGALNSFVQAQPPSPFPGVVNFDVVVNRNPTPIPISTDSNNPTKLFDLVFDIGANAAPGKYAVNLMVNTASGLYVPNYSIADPAGLGNLIAVQGAFQVTAVPEPTPLFGAVALATYGAFQRRRRRKRRAVQQVVEEIGV